MSDRSNQSPEARERERIATRERMRRYREDPAYRERVNGQRATRDAERKLVDADLVERLRNNKKRYYESRKGDPSFWAPRKEYIRRWKAERLEDEQYEAFLSRIEAEDNGATIAEPPQEETT